MKNSVLKEKIEVNESILKMLIESIVVSLLIILTVLLIVKLTPVKVILNIMWYVISYPECMIISFFPVLLAIYFFIRIVVISIKSKKD